MRPSIVFVGFMVLSAATSHASPASAQVTAEDVRQAIEHGSAYLIGQQNKETGDWVDYVGFRGGVTALCTLSLINCGVPLDDPAIVRALAYLEALGTPKQTYVTSLQTMVFAAADPEKYRQRIRQNVLRLEETQIRKGDRAGCWGYGMEGGSISGDNSNAQFAILALHEAEGAGVEVQESTWRLALDYWRRCQNEDGSWGYRYPEERRATGSMTCAGITSLIICSGRLQSGAARVSGERVECCGAGESDSRLELALQWMGAHFTLDSNPTAGRARFADELFYYRYGLERAGRLSGRRFFESTSARTGKLELHDWYREGAERLVASQDKLSGFWKGAGRAENHPHIATPLALLFLSKGRWPVVMAKVKHSSLAGAADAGAAPQRDWDLHSAGAPNLVKYVGRQWKRELTWQTVDVRGAGVADLLESPVLFFSGRDSLRLSKEEKQNLRDYIDQGGFLFAEAADGDGCNGAGFHRDFIALMKELFPASPLRKLRPDHPIWFAQEKVTPSDDRPLWGVDACCRTSIVYCPRNLSCYWELANPDRKTDYPASVQTAVGQSLAIGNNVLAYATNRDPKYKLERASLAVGDGAESLKARGALSAVKISHSGGADDAPNAYVNLLRIVGRELKLPVAAERRLAAPSDPELLDYPVAFMQGRRSFQFSMEDRAALKAYLERGGFLFTDAICASEPFAKSFRSEMAAIFPEASLKRLPVDHPLLSSEFRGFDLSRVELIDPSSRAGEGIEVKKTLAPPWLEGLEIDGRLAVVFSPYDLSCALENHSSMECKGYSRESAEKIGVNAILYALQQ